jgi:hypothetical protein
VRGDQHGIARSDAEGPAGVKVGLRGGLPPAGLGDVEAALDEVRQTGPLEQRLRQGRAAVRERGHAQAGVAGDALEGREAPAGGQRDPVAR